MWSNAGVAWINSVDWERCFDPDMDIKDFEGCPCYVGLDLASKKDIASRMRMFKKGDDYYLFSKHYTTEENTKGGDKEHYNEWVKDGYLIAHPGARIDIEQIQEDIKGDAKRFDLSGEINRGGEVCGDPWNAQQLMTNLINENVACVEINQSVAGLSEPMKELEVLIIAGKLHHDGNPVTAWMFQNVYCEPDFKDNIFPRKENKSSLNKIDGAVASINAMARAMFADTSSMPIPIFV